MQSATNSDSEMHPTNLKGISFYPNPLDFKTFCKPQLDLNRLIMVLRIFLKPEESFSASFS